MPARSAILPLHFPCKQLWGVHYIVVVVVVVEVLLVVVVVVVVLVVVLGVVVDCY